VTPKQHELLWNLQNKMGRLEHYIGYLRRDLDLLPTIFESTLAQNKGEFTSSEINDLIRLNERLSALEQYLCDLGEKECLNLDARVADPNDPLDDFEIEATLYFTLGTDDPAFDEDEDGFLTQRLFSLKHVNREWGLGDGLDHREPRHFPGDLDNIPHCWLFHDLYDHDYGLEQPALTLQDCLRVDSIWVDVAVHHQATLDIKTGQWLPPSNPDK
jgi:hypothetical protein